MKAKAIFIVFILMFGMFNSSMVQSGSEKILGKWTGEKIYSPGKGATANCSAEMPDNNTLILSISKGIISNKVNGQELIELFEIV